MSKDGVSSQGSGDHESIPVFISDLSHSWFQIWNMYLRWFSWHTGLHFIALAGVFTIDAIRENYMVFASIMMLIFAISGLFAAISMIVYDGSVRSLLKLILSGNVQDNSRLILDQTESHRDRLRLRANLIFCHSKQKRDPRLKSQRRRRQYFLSMIRFYFFDGCRYPLFGSPIAHAGKFGALVISVWIVFIWLLIFLFSLSGGFASEVSECTHTLP